VIEGTGEVLRPLNPFPVGDHRYRRAVGLSLPKHFTANPTYQKVVVKFMRVILPYIRRISGTYERPYFLTGFICQIWALMTISFQ